MTDKKKMNIVKQLAGEVSGPDALAALTQLVNATRESIEIHETESTKREKHKTYRETEVRRIKSSEKALASMARKIRLRRHSRDSEGSTNRPCTGDSVDA